MALFPTIFAIMETALVEYKLSEAENKKEQGLRQLLWETFGLKWRDPKGGGRHPKFALSKRIKWTIIINLQSTKFSH